MANASRPPAQRRRDFPVGIPVQPPPGWRPKKTLPALPPLPVPATAPFHSQVSLVVQAMLLALMVFVCTTIGWLWVKGPRRAKTNVHAAAKAPAPEKKDPVRAPAPAPIERPSPPPAPPSPAVVEPPPVPRVVEPPPRRPEPERPAPPPPPPPPAPTPPTPTGPVLTYEKDILPIMQRVCISCHGTPKKRAGLDLRTFAALKQGGDNGAGVTPGSPDAGTLMESIVSGRMPPKGKGKLTAAEKQLIRDWIASGAKSARGR